MAGQAVKIDIEVNNIDVEMDRALRTIEQYGYPSLMRDPDDLLDRSYRAEHVRQMGQGDDLGLRCQCLLERIEQEISFVVDVHPFQDGAPALAQKMPRHDVGVVFHDRKDDLVAFLDEGLAESGSDQIDCLGRRFREDDLASGPGVEESAQAFTRGL